MAEIMITESIDVFASDPKRPGKYDRWVTYTVDGIRTGLAIVPAETATEVKIKEEINRKEIERAKLVGKKFTI